MYIYHKQYEIKQKNQWNSSNGQLHWFHIDFLWKWSIMDQNYANANNFFSVAKKFWGIQGMPYESYNFQNRPDVSFHMASLDTSWNFLHWSKCLKCEKNTFCSFSVSRRSDNFEVLSTCPTSSCLTSPEPTGQLWTTESELSYFSWNYHILSSSQSVLSVQGGRGQQNSSGVHCAVHCALYSGA